nr:lysine-specific demethylase 8-like [Meriones unguiculatus]
MSTEDTAEPWMGSSTLWKDLRVLLPDTKEELKLDLGEKVDRSVAMLLQRAVELFYTGHWQECLQASEAILDYSWEKLNTGPWRDVDKEWRRVYAFGCLLKALCLCQAPQKATVVAEALRVCDMGLLMGAAILGDILLKVVAVLQAHLLPRKQPACGPHQDQPATKKAKPDFNSAPEVVLERVVPRLRCPALQYFRKHFLVPGRPVILEGVADHWPCMKKWSLQYIQEIAGCRTVPVEVGSRYTDEDWSQTLMTVNEFIQKYILSEAKDIGYLAQHQLFDQVSLRPCPCPVPLTCSSPPRNTHGYPLVQAVSQVTTGSSEAACEIECAESEALLDPPVTGQRLKVELGQAGVGLGGRMFPLRSATAPEHEQSAEITSQEVIHQSWRARW